MALGGTIKGITIEFNGDTTKLGKAFTDINAKAEGVDRALKEVNRALKFNPHNTELLAQKQTLLKTKIAQTKEQLNALKAAQKTLDDDPAVDKTSQEYMKLRREIIEAESKLNHFNAELQKAKYAKIIQTGEAFKTAGQKMRNYIIENQNLTYVEDYRHYQLFENATTYVAITLFNKVKNDKVEYVTMERTNDDDGFWEGKIDVPYEDMCIGGKFYFSCKTMLDKMREITEYGKRLKKEDKAFEVKNGFATLADDVFISKTPMVSRVYHAANPWNIIPVIKSSTGKQEWCYYPYDKNGKLMEEKYVDEVILETLRKSKDKLETRATTEPWYAFGRTQAINDTFKDKWAIKSIIKTTKDTKPVMAPAGTGVYGGLYILTEHPEGLDVLETQDFINYIMMLGKYKSGGYYTFSSKELENYLNWSYGKKKD